MLGIWWQKDRSDIVILGHSKSECQTNGLCSKAAQFAISISYLPLRALRAEHSGEEHINVEIASGTPFRRVVAPHHRSSAKLPNRGSEIVIWT